VSQTVERGGAAAIPDARMRVAIRGVETIPLRLPFAAPFTMAAPHEQKREGVDVLIVRIHTDQGVSGIGETQAWRRQGSAEILPNLVRTVREHLAPLMIGRSPFDVAGILHDLNACISGSLYPQAAIGDALYDLQGKLFGVPVCDLLGGRCRDTVRVGLALGIASPPEALIARAEAAYQEGYRHIRIKIGLDPDVDVENIRRVREHFGTKVVLRADANGGMTYPDAVRLLKKLEAFDLDIVEQPVPGWDLDGMAALCRTVAIPISADESLTTDHSLLEISQKQAAKVIQTKTGKNGGLYYTRRLWEIAEAAGIAIFPGNHPSTSVATAAVAHLCASWPRLPVVGDFQTGLCDMLAADIATEPLSVRNGYVKVPAGPGLGIQLDDEKVKRFRIDE
jgi:L-alanine-DL-glutamate epimerase-like enolase superfamily enzyme